MARVSTLEQDMLDPQCRPDPQELLSIEEELENIGDSVWAVGPLDGLLKSWVHSVDARGEYNATLERHGGSGRDACRSSCTCTDSASQD